MHIHTIIDHDKHFIINPTDRKILPETPEKNKLVQYDHNSERFTFEIPRYIEGHDMSQCDHVEIHYTNISSDQQKRNVGVYEANDIEILSTDSEKIVFSWLISRNATQLNGTLNFAVRMMCVDGEKITYDWHTGIHSGVTISTGINNEGTITEYYADVLEEWRQKLFNNRETIINIVLPVDAWTQSVDMTYYTQDITLIDITVTNNTKITLQPTTDQLIDMIHKNIVMFADNNSGHIQVYSVNEKPNSTITIKAIVKEINT